MVAAIGSRTVGRWPSRRNPHPPATDLDVPDLSAHNYLWAVGKSRNSTNRMARPESRSPSASSKGITTMERLLFTPIEAARILGIGRSKLYELLASGQLHSVQIGSCRRVPAQALHNFLAGLSEAS
jgi:excisionase family DNA binding protein